MSRWDMEYRLHVAPQDYDSLALLLDHCKAGTP